MRPPSGVKRQCVPVPRNCEILSAPLRRTARSLSPDHAALNGEQGNPNSRILSVRSWSPSGRTGRPWLALAAANGRMFDLNLSAAGRPGLRGIQGRPPLTLPLIFTFQKVSSPAGDSNPRCLSTALAPSNGEVGDPSLRWPALSRQSRGLGPLNALVLWPLAGEQQGRMPLALLGETNR